MRKNHHEKEWYYKKIQECLNGISLCKPDEGQRVKILHRKAKNYLRRLKEQCPELEIIEVPKREGSDVRRGASFPASAS